GRSPPAPDTPTGLVRHRLRLSLIAKYMTATPLIMTSGTRGAAKRGFSRCDVIEVATPDTANIAAPSFIVPATRIENAASPAINTSSATPLRTIHARGNRVLKTFVCPGMYRSGGLKKSRSDSPTDSRYQRGWRSTYCTAIALTMRTASKYEVPRSEATRWTTTKPLGKYGRNGAARLRAGSSSASACAAAWVRSVAPPMELMPQ